MEKKGKRTSKEHRVAFEKETGIVDVISRKGMTQVSVGISSAEESVTLFRSLADAGISVFLVKLHHGKVDFMVDREKVRKARSVSAALGFPAATMDRCALVSVIAGNMRELPGVMATIVGALYRNGIGILETGDAYDSVSCLIHEKDMSTAVSCLKREFALS